MTRAAVAPGSAPQCARGSSHSRRREKGRIQEWRLSAAGFDPDPVLALKRLIRLGILAAQTSRLDASLEEVRRIEARLAQMPQLASKRRCGSVNRA
jgi:hypothetical protein